MAFTIEDVAYAGIDAVVGKAGYLKDGAAVPSGADSNKVYDVATVGGVFILTSYIKADAPQTFMVASEAAGLELGKYLAKAASIPGTEDITINYGAIV